MEQEIYRKRLVFLFFTCLSFLFIFWWYLPVLKYIQYTGIVFILEGVLLFSVLTHLKKTDEEKEFLGGFKQIVPIELAKNKLPLIKDGLYLGEGFIWEQRHAKYVYEKMKDDLTKTLAQVKVGKDTDLGGVNFHAVEREKKDIIIPKAEFSGHCCIVATTRAGKTTLLRNIATQLIRAKEPVVIFDPKGEHFLLNSIFEETVNTYGTAEKFSFISSAFPLTTDTFNPFRTFVNISDIGDRVASVLPQTGDSAPFTSYSFYMVDVITRCLVYLGENITLSNLKGYSLSPAEWRTLGLKVFQKFFNQNNLQIKERQEEAGGDGKKPSLLDNYKYSYFIYKKQGYFNEVIENLLGILEQPREHLQKMTSSLIPFFSLISSDEKPIIFAPDRPSFEWGKITDKRVVYFFFSSLEAAKTVPLVLKLALQSLISFVGRRQVRGEGGQEPIWLLIDEFGQINYPEFADLLAQAGSSGLKVIMAMQSLSDLEKSIFGSAGGRTVAQRILDNTNTKIFLRNTDNNTARRLADDIGKVSIPEVSRQTTYRPEDLDVGYDVGYHISKNYKDKYLLDPAWTQALPKGEAFVWTSGTLFKIKVPILDRPEKILLTKEEFAVRGTSEGLLATKGEERGGRCIIKSKKRCYVSWQG